MHCKTREKKRFQWFDSENRKHKYVVVQSAENVCIIHSPHGQSQLFIHCLPTVCFWIYTERCQYGCRVTQVPVHIPFCFSSFSDQNDRTISSLHRKITKKMNYKVVICFFWSPKLMRSERLGLTGHIWFRSGSVNDSSETRSPAATANTLRFNFSQTTQLDCVTKVKKLTITLCPYDIILDLENCLVVSFACNTKRITSPGSLVKPNYFFNLPFTQT